MSPCLPLLIISLLESLSALVAYLEGHSKEMTTRRRKASMMDVACCVHCFAFAITVAA